MIDRYLFRWHWECPFSRGYVLNPFKCNCLSGNEGVELSESIIRKYSDYWDWSTLSRRCGDLANRKLFLTFLEKWDKTSISYTALPENTNILVEFDWFWDWSAISGNSSIHFTPELLEKYKERLNWNSLSRNRHILDTMELIEKYPDKWNWTDVSHDSPCCGSLPFIHRNHHHIDFTFLGFNDHVRWCVELLCAYEERFDFKTMSTRYLCHKIEYILWEQVFSGWLDEKRLVLILDEIEKLNLKEMPF